ncbi:serine/threonine-protein kinase 11-interacting protein isoform X2 [Eupeodes corollae]|uniref:serine/threonine-protein kinase 11-interacting protein isoform X2 n=1 Tax=Eupeodes corollae TaxID=290404 RepID=UPI0024926E8C|nr:serine/threonine-protein kinase 11-interacting protein isoform X2 [Eupeodes corollae]
MDPKKITELANLLRNNGDKVLNSEFKLTLTGSLLRALNDSFTLISDSSEIVAKQTFQVVKPNYSKSNVFRDLQLIHDFVQKTLYLCIIHYPGDDYFDGVIDISKFQSLKRLEVQKTNVKQIVGIQPLRSQLHQLVCVRSLQSVVEIITHCGGDNSNGFVWNELKTADFSYNNLKTVDSSLEFAQYLQHLNLRHNQLVSVEAIKWLPNLKTLDLSYNRLITVPNFHVETSKRLQFLNLSNNFIEDLIGISKLDLLTDLDLSDNCLLDHNSLFPLCALVSLKYLNLYGNPLYCHPNHRLATAQFLHKDTCTVKFILDYEPLSKNEKALTGTQQHASHSTYVAKYMIKSNSRPTPLNKSSSSQTPASSVGSSNSFQQRTNIGDEEIGYTSSTTDKSKRVKIRQVIIECSDQKIREKDAVVDSKTTERNVKSNKDHLETKKQFKILRNKYGAGWLQNENAHIVHTMLGLSSSNASIAIDSELEADLGITKTTDDITPIEYSLENNAKTKDVSGNKNAFESETTTQENKQIFHSNSKDKEKERIEPLDIAPHLKSIYADSVNEEEFSDPETDEDDYIVNALGTNHPVILTISSNYIREKHTLNHKTKVKWSLKILESCDRMKSNMLRINFDTIKMDKKERVYTVEECTCQELEKKLRAILSKRDLFEMNQKVFRCINCSCQFSVENTLNNHQKQDIYCPDCKSTFVTEIHSLPASLEKISKDASKLPVAKIKDVIEEEKPLTFEPSLYEDKNELISKPENRMNESIGSTNSLNESSSCSKISHSQDSFDSNQSVAGSSATDRENYLKSNTESDVDIISNPSQSSIEVLDNIHSSRKNSEDRKVSQSSNLKTINDYLVSSGDTQQNVENKDLDNLKQKTFSAQVHLTESSSSGSVTDSVCTTYDQGNVIPVSDEEKNVMKTEFITEETKKKGESKLSTMFGGLLQSTNVLMSRSTVRASESECLAMQPEKYNFNYIDFSDVDHRLKFYFYQTKFEEQSEHFKWIVKGKIYNQNSRTITNGIVVMSTIKCYIMEEFGRENNNISKWLRPVVSVTVDRLESIQLLPWKVGLCFTLRDWGGFLLLLQDILRTDSLLFYFTRNVLPDQCELNYQIPEKVLHRLTKSMEGEQIKMFSLLNCCELKSNDKIQRLEITGLLTTDTRLFITTSNLSWLSTTSESGIEIDVTQLMSNLVEVERPERNVCILHFHDETQDKSELWKCTFETKENAESCLNAIGQSWEKLFGVPLLSN